MHKGHHKQISKWNAKHRKVAGKAFNIGEVWNPVCYHGNRLLSSFCGDLIESYRKESNISDKNWLRFFFHHILPEKKRVVCIRRKMPFTIFKCLFAPEIFKFLKYAN